MFFLFTDPKKITEVFLVEVHFLYILNGVHGKVISLPNDNSNKNK